MERTSFTFHKPDFLNKPSPTTGVAAALGTEFAMPSTCGGACETCPNRGRCGFSRPSPDVSPAPSGGAAPPVHCPGISSEAAGHASACEGCPNRAFCKSGAGRRAEDPDMPLIRAKMAQISHKIVVLSGKGGVGKSTFSSQLAWALAAREDAKYNVGIMDVDICGPSIPTMMNAESEAIRATGSGALTPAYVSENLALVSVGLLLDKSDDAVIWRGPKKNGLIKQLLRDVDWGGHLDYLVVDTPPGTSDEHLSVVNYLKGGDAIDGAVVVTSPQDVALADVRKEIRFCKRVGLRIVGVVENMSGFICPCCHKESVIFPKTSGGAAKMCKEMEVPFLGSLSLDPLIARSCDEGKPYFEDHPESPAAVQFHALVDQILKAF